MPKKYKRKCNGGSGASDYAMSVYGNSSQQHANPMTGAIDTNRGYAMHTRGGSYKRNNKTNSMMVPFNLMFKKYSKQNSHCKTNKLYKILRHSRKNKTRR